MDSLKHFINFKIEEITKLKEQHGEPSIVQLSKYTQSTADQLMLQVVAHAPPEIQRLCAEGVRHMGWDRQTHAPIPLETFTVQVYKLAILIK